MCAQMDNHIDVACKTVGDEQHGVEKVHAWAIALSCKY